MAEEEKKEEKKEESTAKLKKGFNFKIILIGLPLFIVQLVLVYFITATFLVKNTSGSHEGTKSEHVEESEEESGDGEEGESGAPQHIFSINDLVINPAGTSGQRLLLLSVGLGVGDEEKAKLLEENEVLIKDVILSTVSKKSLRTLSRIEMKDSLKAEIAEKVNEAFPKAKVKGIYFSKYVIN